MADRHKVPCRRVDRRREPARTEAEELAATFAAGGATVLVTTATASPEVPVGIEIVPLDRFIDQLEADRATWPASS